LEWPAREKRPYIRFNGDRGYLTDAEAPGLLILDLKTSAVRRVLDNDPSTIDDKTMMADGKILRDEKGKELPKGKSCPFPWAC
jgi:hypothetical protein